MCIVLWIGDRLGGTFRVTSFIRRTGLVTVGSCYWSPIRGYLCTLYHPTQILVK